MRKSLVYVSFSRFGNGFIHDLQVYRVLLPSLLNGTVAHLWQGGGNAGGVTAPMEIDPVIVLAIVAAKADIAGATLLYLSELLLLTAQSYDL